jgi:hypothetical protein
MLDTIRHFCKQASFWRTRAFGLVCFDPTPEKLTAEVALPGLWPGTSEAEVTAGPTAPHSENVHPRGSGAFREHTRPPNPEWLSYRRRAKRSPGLEVASEPGIEDDEC